MKNIILEKFTNIPYFTIEGFRQIAGIEKASDYTSRITLSRWVKSGEILRLTKGKYMTRDFYVSHRSEPSFYSVISAIIRPQSYISLETILQRYGVLSEITYPITAVTSKHTRVINNMMGTFTYRSIQKNLFNHFKVFEYYGVNYAEATLAKALFDYLYFLPVSTFTRIEKFNLVEEFRLNLEDFHPHERQEFGNLIKESGIKKMDEIYTSILRTIWQV